MDERPVLNTWLRNGQQSEAAVHDERRMDKVAMEHAFGECDVVLAEVHCTY